MIGLGSNRLTVCRRGGMSVTQAGRGGMEWLAGGRGVSPYSAQATAALKAAFTAAQWQTIRDYGVAHPEIVGYMNAYAPEDAKIAYSLVPGLGTRQIAGNGTSYLVTNVKSSSALIYEADIAPYIVSGSATIISGGIGWGNKYIQFGGIPGGTTLWRAYGNSTGSTGISAWNTGVWGKVTIDSGKFYRDDTLLTTISYTDFETDNMMGLWCAYRSGTASEISQGQFRNFVAKDKATGNIVARLVPYIKNGQKGMIDLVSGTFCGDATGNNGFTISETPPNHHT